MTSFLFVVKTFENALISREFLVNKFNFYLYFKKVRISNMVSNGIENIELTYDVPVEISAMAFKIIMGPFAGTCAGREENGRYYIKPWMLRYKEQLEKIIESNPIK